MGASVGITASATDADAGDSYLRTSDDAGGLFTIDADGVVTSTVHWIMRQPPVMTSRCLPQAPMVASHRRASLYL